MSKTKNKPGIHLLETKWKHVLTGKPDYHWHIVSRNGRIIARSSETYSRKSGAVKSISTTFKIFQDSLAVGGVYKAYYDHSKPDCPLVSYI
jgi:uncharacterized protein YegP (UPF0339 family)